MKKTVIILILLISSFSFAQVVKADVVFYKHLTTAERDSYTPPANTAPTIYNITTDRLEYWDGSAWNPVDAGGGNVFEKELADAENNINVGFTLTSTTAVFLNGQVVPNIRWSGEGTAVLNVSLDTKEHDNLTVKN